jgi:hypothetical protein
MVAGQVRQVHVAGVVHANDQLVGCDKRVSCFVDRHEDVVAADAIALQDGHGHIIAHLV